MPVQTLCTVAETIRLNAYAYSLTLDVGEELSREVSCGQFVHIKCGHSRLLRRPISICDWKENHLRVVFEVRGEGTEWLSRRKVGDTLDVLGPLGHGFDVGGKRLLLVGGGIGAPPLLACAKRAADRGAEVRAALGFRDAEHTMLTEEFGAVCTSVDLVSDDGTAGRRGLVTVPVEEILRAAEENASEIQVLACGPKTMLRGVAELAARYGAPCQVSLEERMGCGVGACLVCACKTTDGHRRHVCKDGPVFNAGEVDWDD